MQPPRDNAMNGINHRFFMPLVYHPYVTGMLRK